MATLLIVFTLIATVNEGLNEYLFNPIVIWVSEKVNDGFDYSIILRYTTLISGILLTWFFTLPLIAFIAAQLDLPSVEIDPIITLFFGLAIGRGSQFFHDLWSSLVAIKESYRSESQ